MSEQIPFRLYLHGGNWHACNKSGWYEVLHCTIHIESFFQYHGLREPKTKMPLDKIDNLRAAYYG
jgi:hypothetical protein